MALIHEELKDVKSEAHKELTNQIASEFMAGRDNLQNKRDEWGARLKLYVNQMKDKTAISDPLFFTIFNTVFASLYDDKLIVTWKGREDGDDDKAEYLNGVYKFDYDAMQKDLIDYQWGWNTLFFGKGFVIMNSFDRKDKYPEVIVPDPMAMYFDPNGVAMHDMFGNLGVRFFGRELLETKESLRSDKFNFNIEELSPHNGLGSILENNNQLRSQANNTVFDSASHVVGENADILTTEHWTTWKGQKVKVKLLGSANELRVISLSELPWKNWDCVIERQIYPIPQDFWGANIGDLIEDKQRARAKFMNLSMLSAEYATYGMYLYNNKIIDSEQVMNPKPNKWIGVAGDIGQAVTPVVRERVGNEVQWILGMLDAGAQQATATPAIQQGLTPDTSRSATEIAAQKTSVDKRYSLTAKIWTWSERRYAKQWYRCYDKFFKGGLNEKAIRIEGALSPKYMKVTRKDFIYGGCADPDLEIESSLMAEGKRISELQSFSNFLQLGMQDPAINKRYAIRHFAKLSGMTRDQVNLLYPKDADELHAEKENELILAGEVPEISVMDNHIVHLEAHSKLEEGAIRDAHIQAHYDAMEAVKARPDLIPAASGINSGNPSEQNPMPGGVQNPTNMTYQQPNAVS